MLDNGAFSMWKRGIHVDWDRYYSWTERWLAYGNAWAVIPDSVDGTEEDNDRLIEKWPHGDRGAPVWHLHESFDKLVRLVARFPRVCIGSSAQYSEVGTPEWCARMDDVFNTIAVPSTGAIPTKLHMLRGLKLCVDYPYPFDSVDSTNIARNHNRGVSTLEMAQLWEERHTPTHWKPNETVLGH